MTTPYRTSGAVAPARAPWWLRWLAAIAGPFLPPQELSAYRWYRRAVGGRWCRQRGIFEPPCWNRVEECPLVEFDGIVVGPCTHHHCACEVWP